MKRIIIKHQSGSKANQVEIFSLEEHPELTLGRDPSLNVIYDPARDDPVSRKHAVIQWDPQKDNFTVIDLNSRNGVFVNKRKVNDRAEIHHGDTIQLGAKGPKFVFELDPPPAILLPLTKEYPLEKTLPPTREGYAQEQPSAYASTPTDSDMVDSLYGDSGISPRITGSTGDSGVYHKSVGRDTVERLIYQNKSESRKYLINIAALLLGVVVIVAGYFVYNNITLQRKLGETEQKITHTQETIQQASSSLQTIKEVMSPKQIAEMYGPATVQIEVSWKLVDLDSGRQIYHHYVMKKDKSIVPLYVELKDGSTIPLLVTVPKANDKPIGYSTKGSGFVIDEKGFILTNRHLAAPWFGEQNMPAGEVQLKGGQQKRINAFKWQPNNLSKNSKWKRVDGRLDTLEVIFYKSKLRIPAKLVRVSNEHDVALIKIDTPSQVPKVDPYNSYTEVKPGDTITVLGYPDLPNEPVIVTTSKDIFAHEPDVTIIPDPTVTTGVIGKVIRGERKSIDDPRQYYFSQWDSYQLTINQLGSGISGGPIFDDHGRVIGIFYGLNTNEGSNVAYAIPIKFGLDLMAITPATQE